jgi:serine/threonine protein kinase
VPLSSQCKDFLEKILAKDPEKRLGAKRGISEIKSHPFFKGVDWQRVQTNQTEPPAKAYLSDMAMSIIEKQPFMLKDHPRTKGRI